MTSKQPTYGTVDRSYGIRLATTPPDRDGPIWMVNLMRYRAEAVYREVSDTGPGSGVTGVTGVTGREADERYSPIDILHDIGASVVFMGDVAEQLLGDSPVWDRVAVVRYPTRRSFIEMQQREDFREKHLHKEAGMAETIVAGCLPVDPPAGHLGEVAWDDVEYPPSDGDGPLMVIHVLRFAEGDAEADMAAYQTAAFAVASAHGARISGWFGVEGTIIGDGRRWDQVRFNLFPSRAAFMAVVADPSRLEAQRAHREVSIADTYTLLVRPNVDNLAASIRSA